MSNLLIGTSIAHFASIGALVYFAKGQIMTLLQSKLLTYYVNYKKIGLAWRADGWPAHFNADN